MSSTTRRPSPVFVSVFDSRSRLRWFAGIVAFGLMALAGCGGGGGDAGNGDRLEAQLIVNDPQTNPLPPPSEAGPEQALSSSARLVALPGDGLIAIAENFSSTTSNNISTLSWTAQRFSAAGVANGPVIAISTGPVEGATLGASLTPLHGGGYVAVWVGRLIESARFGASIHALTMQAYSAAGVPIGQPMEIDATQPWYRWIGGPPAYPVAAPLQAGGFVVAWVKAGEGGLNLRSQRFNPDGTPAGSAQVVAADSGGYLGASGLSTGGYMITWDGGARAYSASDAPVGPAQAMGPTWTGPAFEGNPPSLAPLASGGAVAVWTSLNGSNLMAREMPFAPNASAMAAEAVVDDSTPLDAPHDQPAAAGLADGSYVVAWIEAPGDGSGVHARRYSATGAPLGPETRIGLTTTNASYPVVLGLSDGGFVIGWTATGTDGVRRDYLRAFSSAALSQTR